MLNETLNKAQINHYQNKLHYEIDAWDLSEALKRGENIVVIDARSRSAYQVEHIPGAVSFPWRTMQATTASERLDASVLYVTYCDGIGCNASTKGALKLAELGYRVKELIGGLDWWKRDGYTTASAAAENISVTADCGCDGK